MQNPSFGQFSKLQIPEWPFACWLWPKQGLKNPHKNLNKGALDPWISFYLPIFLHKAQALFLTATGNDSILVGGFKVYPHQLQSGSTPNHLSAPISTHRSNWSTLALTQKRRLLNPRVAQGCFGGMCVWSHCNRSWCVWCVVVPTRLSKLKNSAIFSLLSCPHPTMQWQETNFLWGHLLNTPRIWPSRRLHVLTLASLKPSKQILKHMIHLMKLLALFVSSVNKLKVKQMPAACEWFLYLILSFGHILPLFNLFFQGLWFWSFGDLWDLVSLKQRCLWPRSACAISSQSCNLSTGWAQWCPPRFDLHELLERAEYTSAVSSRSRIVPSTLLPISPQSVSSKKNVWEAWEVRIQTKTI